ncbi:MAG: hypothetical protein GY757_56640, partial [bacterium]|nr:hypothetical protein [bacterium]
IIPIILGVLVMTGLCSAQTLPFRNYSKKNGLPGDRVQCMHQETNGYLWFGTRNGLSRFDGHRFTNFPTADNPQDNFISTLLEDREGTLWIGTLGGKIYSYSGTTFKNHIRHEQRRTTSAPYANAIFAGAEDHNGILWFATANGLLRFDGKKSKTYTTADGLPSNGINGICVGKDGKPWLATQSGLSCLTENGFVNYTTADGLVHNTATTVLADSAGDIWIGTANGLSRFHNGSFTTYTRKNGLSHNQIMSLMEDRDKNLWIGTWDGATCFTARYLNKRAQHQPGGSKHEKQSPIPPAEVVTYGTRNGLVGDYIYSIIQDREGNIWFATYNGVSCLNPLKIITYTEKDGLAGRVVDTILEDREGNVWLGTYKSLSRYSNGQFKTYTTKNGLLSNSVNSLFEDRDGKIWIATIRGISVFNTGDFTNYTAADGLTGDFVYNITQTRDGTIWIGHTNGVNRIKSNTISEYSLTGELIDVFKISEDSRGNLWFATTEGLFRLQNETVTQFTTRDGLPTGVINTVFEDSKKNLWIGSEAGVSLYRRHEEGFTNYSKKNGDPLPADNILFIIEDHQQRLWLGAVGGLACFDGKTFKPYTARRYGFMSDTWCSGMVGSDGKLWLGSSMGLTLFSPQSERPNRIPPPIRITSMKVMEKEIPRSGLNRLAHTQNYIRFEYAAMCFSAPESVKYKYRLDSVDMHWHETENRSIFYYLQPGDYRFRVKAVNSDGIESIAPAETAFEILPAFWQTIRFKGLMIAMALLLTGLLVFWRYKQIRDKSELKARTRQLMMSQRMELMGNLAAGTIHDLKNLLAIIMEYSREVGEEYEKESEHRQNIEVIKDTTDKAMQMAGRILAFSRLKNETAEKEDLVLLMDEIIRTLDITRPRSVRVHWVPPKEEILFTIQPTRFQQLVMNLFLNAIHAMPRGGDLTARLARREDKKITITISDTGTGIEPGTMNKIFEPLFTTREKDKGTGLGLFVVKQILDEHGGKIEVRSEVGKGATFVILLPG